MPDIITARSLAGMLRSRIQRSAEREAETISLGHSFAHQLHHFLTEIGNGPEYVRRSGEAPADVGDPSGDRRGDWGLRAREVHLDGLSVRAAGGTWFAVTNGADGLARLDNGSEMFPVIGEWHEIELIEELVNGYRRGDIIVRQQPTEPGDLDRPVALSAASGIEAATADETRSGSAEGKSPIGEAETPDTPRPAPGAGEEVGG